MANGQWLDPKNPNRETLFYAQQRRADKTLDKWRKQVSDHDARAKVRNQQRLERLLKQHQAGLAKKNAVPAPSKWLTTRGKKK